MRVRLPILLLLCLLLFVNPEWNYAGIPVLILGQVLRGWAVGYIHKDKVLSTEGPYSLCRHPLYLGTFLAGTGLCVFSGRRLNNRTTLFELPGQL